jgi:iron complex transport system ATP-binding protein
MTAAELEARGVTVHRGARTVLDSVSVYAAPGDVIGVVGPNGCGKSTLLRALVGVARPQSGEVLLDGRDITTLSARRRARSVATVLQENPTDFDLRAREVVAMGRAPFKRMLQRDDAADAAIIDRALELVGVAHLADQPVTMMSGGERQRVVVARAVAQQPRLLVLDEPINHLDIRHQFDVLALPRTLGVTAVIALHDLNLAAHHCDRLYVVHHGRVVRSGPPAEVLTAELLREVYDIGAVVRPHPVTGRPEISYGPAAGADFAGRDLFL